MEEGSKREVLTQKISQGTETVAGEGGGGARDSIVGWGNVLQAGRTRVPFRVRSLDFSVDLILPAALRHCSSLTSNRDYYKESFYG
jgi:hypothetical protein